MKKRLRKKLHVGEFQEFGFTVTMKFQESNTEESLNQFVEAFLNEVVDPNGLDFAGSGDRMDFTGFLVLAKRGSATEAQRAATTAWLETQESVVSFEVGELVDAWYP